MVTDESASDEFCSIIIIPLSTEYILETNYSSLVFGQYRKRPFARVDDIILLLLSPKPISPFLSYRQSSIKYPGGLFISNTFERGRGVFNLEKTMASVLHKELEYIVEKLKGKRLEVMQPRIRIKSKLPVSK